MKRITERQANAIIGITNRYGADGALDDQVMEICGYTKQAFLKDLVYAQVSLNLPIRASADQNNISNLMAREIRRILE